MQQSKIIEVNGVFLGAAVSLRDHAGWRVVATNARAEPANGQIGATYQDAAMLARHAYWTAATMAA